MELQNKPRKFCIICGEKIWRKGDRYILFELRKAKRGRNALTDCRKCSKIYNRLLPEERNELKENNKEE